jgi:hypothetical protein
MGLSVNGTAVAVPVSFAPTGSWRTWRDVTAVVSLAAGTNTVRLATTGRNGPNLDSLALQAAGASPAVTYQAETATLSGPLVLSNHPGFTGSAFADYQRASGDWVEFNVDVPADGTYSLDFRFANGSSAARPLELRVDGASAGAVAFAPTGSWNDWKTTSLPVVLTAGRHAVRLTSTGYNGPNLDALTVTPQLAEPVTLQAESATLSGAVASSASRGFTGNGFADYLNSQFDYVEFTFDAPSQGDYELKFRYANGSRSDRPLELKVNGTSDQPLLRFAPTASWLTWGTETAAVRLPAGRHTIRLTATGKSGPNLDALTIRMAGPF